MIPVSREAARVPSDPARQLLMEYALQPMECAGRAKRRRRFGYEAALAQRSQSGVALRLPPHSKGAALLTGADHPVHPSLE
jgi:hypothetical protein